MTVSAASPAARLRAALAGALDATAPVALVYAIPHDIELVADGMGPPAVETLLDLMGRRLAGLAGPRDSVARTADDAFAMVVRDVGPESRALIGAEEAAERSLDALNAPFSITGDEIARDASVGVSVHPHHGATIEAEEVARHGIAPERIVFELTESAWVRSSHTFKPVLDEVRAAGMMFAVDDFGAGYSSLSRLRELPAEIIKVDRAFLRGAPADPQVTEILLGTLRVAAATGADVTVEGVETEEQLELLEAHGLRFLLSRLVPAEQFETALRGTIVPERGR